MKSIYLFLIIFLAQITNSQGQVNIDKKMEWYTPQFKDSTLLFFSDSLTWECKSSNGNVFWYSQQLYQIDYKHLDSCSCFHGVYLKAKENGFSPTFYKTISKNKYGTLIKKQNNQFIYWENPKFVTKPKEILFQFSMESIIYSDTLFTENEYGEVLMGINNHFNVTQIKQ